MHVVYASQDAPNTYSKSIFLAGPSPRVPGRANWRTEALDTLALLGYDGVVFVPLPEHGDWSHGFDAQREWEIQALNMADQIVFWVPRDLTVVEGILEAPALTTNIEWGKYFRTGRAVLGFPKEAPNTRYLAGDAKDESVPVFHTLSETLAEAVKRVGQGAERSEGERFVPLGIWKLPHFQGWYKAQVAAGNQLNKAEVLWTFRVGPNKAFTFAFSMHVSVFIASEGRNKTNEFVFSRTDLSTCVLYRGNKVVLVREFRSPVRNERGFMYDLAGGSSWKQDENPLEVIAHEVGEEIGIEIEPGRFIQHETRQAASSLSTHVVHLFSAELTEEEVDHLISHAGEVHGVLEDTERTYAEVWGIQDICNQQLVDWSTLGMILSVVRV